MSLRRRSSTWTGNSCAGGSRESRYRICSVNSSTVAMLIGTSVTPGSGTGHASPNPSPITRPWGQGGKGRERVQSLR